MVPPWLIPAALLLSLSPRTQNQQATVTDRGTSLQDARPFRAQISRTRELKQEPPGPRLLRVCRVPATIRVPKTSCQKKRVLIPCFIYYLLGVGCVGGCVSNLFPSVFHEMWNVLKNLLIFRLTSKCFVGVSFVETCGFCSAVAPGLFISHYLFNLFPSCPGGLSSGD